MNQHNFDVIPLRHILPPKQSPFPELIERVVGAIPGMTARRNKPSKLTLAKWRLASNLLFDGLYQSYFCINQPKYLGVPLHRSAYGGGVERVQTVGYEVMLDVLHTAAALNLVSIQKGFRRSETDCVMTKILPLPDLIQVFEKLGEVRLERELPKEVIFLRNKRKKRGQERPFGETHRDKSRAYEIGASNSDKTRSMRTRLRLINRSLQGHKVGLYIQNTEFLVLAKRMLNRRLKRRFEKTPEEHKNTSLNMSATCLRRIFSHGRMTLGGRFYGHFVQSLPKESRLHVTIDHLPTIEIDFAGLHPTMAYHLDGLDPPEVDPYDIGLWSSPQEREARRPVIKTFFNSMLNDEYGEAILTKEERRVLGISSPELRRQISAAHPAISHRFDSGYGLSLQYHDSCLAEEIMLRLLAKGITCIPVHDSFVVQIIHAEALRKTMLDVYMERFGKPIRLEERHLYQVDESGKRLYPPQFMLPFKDGEVDFPALVRLMNESRHNRFLAGGPK